MGVVYKFKEEVKEFVIKEKKANPQISCRLMSEHVKMKFGLSLSKSSINALMKELGLSAPIGRRPKKKKPHILMPVLPILSEETTKSIALTKEVLSNAKEDATEQKKDAKEVLEVKANMEKGVELVSLVGKESVGQDKVDKETLEPKTSIGEEIAHKTALEKEKEIVAIERERLKQEELRRIKEEVARKEAEELERRKHKEETEVSKTEKGGWEKAARGESQEGTALYPEIENSGLVLLDAADYLIGASKQIAELIGDALGKLNLNDLNRVKNIIFSSLLPSFRKDELTGLALSRAVKVINGLLKESRCIRIAFSSGAPAFIDSRFYAVWSSLNIPYDFSNTVNNTSLVLNSYFSENKPVVIFNAVGYDIPSPEFLSFLCALNSPTNKISRITFFNGKLEEVADLPLPSPQRRYFIFGLWPWQFSNYRKVDKIGEFRRVDIEELKSTFYTADIELRLFNPKVKEEVILRGASLKVDPKERVRLAILTNADLQAMPTESLVSQYLLSWPNLEEAFEDYNRKVELFTYTANLQNIFSVQVKGVDITGSLNSQEIFNGYLKGLDLYIRRHFLPSGYKIDNFSEMKLRFYDLLVDSSERIGNVRYFCFKPPLGYPHTKALSYILKRFNERGIEAPDGARAYFTIA